MLPLSSPWKREKGFVTVLSVSFLCQPGRVKNLVFQTPKRLRSSSSAAAKALLLADSDAGCGGLGEGKGDPFRGTSLSSSSFGESVSLAVEHFFHRDRLCVCPLHFSFWTKTCQGQTAFELAKNGGRQNCDTPPSPSAIQKGLSSFLSLSLSRAPAYISLFLSS